MDYAAPHSSRWMMFVKESWRITLLWLAGTLLFMGFRIFYLLYFHTQLSELLSTQAIIDGLKTSFAFDSAASGIFFVIPFLANCALQPIRLQRYVAQIRKITAYVFFSCSILLCVISITYISEYGRQFNYFMFEGLYDDKLAIAKTAIMQYKPWGSILTLVILLFMSHRLYRVIERHPLRLLDKLFTQRIGYRIVLVFLIVVLATCAVRGSFESRPVMRKWSSVTPDPFFNDLIINPFRSLIYALKDYYALQSDGVSGQNPYQVDAQLLAEPFNFLEKTATGPYIAKPSQVFLIVMESYDAWPLQQKYADLNLNNEFKQLSKQGIYLDNVLPAAFSTMNSLSSILSGIPYSGVNMSKVATTKATSPLSIFEQMKGLNYQTNFFYGGLLSWQNIGQYVKSQGAENSYSAVDAGGIGSGGVWGIDDGQLFDLVAKKAKENSFNVILSSSYHGPFNLDLAQYDYPFLTQSDYPRAIQALDDELLDPYVLGHLWYSDKMLGRFVKRMQTQYPDALFVVTGDHYSRRYLHGKPNLYELTHVPLLLYGKNLPSNLIATQQVASHLDIGATLMDLLAPQGSDYLSFGHSLIEYQADRKVIGFQTLRQGDDFWRGDFNQQYEFYQVNDKDKQQLLTEARNESKLITSDAIKQYENYMGLAWHMLINGSAKK
ncbi:LTA synthase family protein [Pseudoalteromonas tunicata]|uniref:Sulfatase N-terminal domain-containing protein n=1 Tax=Pseudoalteromonas tunicata D2 TaxID=87626 RepID=A4C725_9GAMM|nr:LTA synthase family protein [Pseudoalteromonas tunicata]ATC95750.1 hypothetical protein PTUN_a3414 [Pseudoalteromonas tunicata]AXT31303.1 hydrolase [Pseudoalteromonas tunicata]EAR29779.1 hypothetical protein PTD2_13204 [Pseudoalteromonas tunicata D2]